MQRDLVRLNAVDWRLARVATPVCAARAPGVVAGSGLALDSLSNYPDNQRPAIASATGMASGVRVIGVATGSPGDAAGLRIGDRLMTIAGQPVDTTDAGKAPSLQAQAADDLLRALPIGRPSELTVERDGVTAAITLEPVARCAVHSVLVVEDFVDAYSDARNLAVTTGLLGFVVNDDELALLAGHELAHIILDPDLKARGLRNKRKEDAADALGARLAECAGYDVARASELWGRFDSTRTLGFLPTLTHRASKTRLRTIAGMAGSADCSALAAGIVTP